MRNGMKKIVSCILAVLMAFVVLPMNVLNVHAVGDKNDPSCLNNFTTAMSITGLTQNEDGIYTVLPDTEYSVQLSFKEKDALHGDLQFANTMTYSFPTGFTALKGTSGTIEIGVKDGDTRYPVKGNTYTVNDNNQLIFSFNTADENYQKLAAADNAEFNLNISGIFSDTTDPIDWGNNVTKEVVINHDHNVTVQKESWYNVADNKVYYKVTVKSYGNNTNVVVSDTVKGNALIFDGEVSCDKDGTLSAVPTSSENVGSFTYTFPSLADKEQAVIQYSTTVDTSKLTGWGTAEQTENDATVKSDESDEKATENTLENSIRYYSINKKGEQSKEDNQIIDWSITYNGEMIGSMGNSTIVDTIDSDSAKIMNYVGGYSVAVYDKSDTLVRTDKKDFSSDDISNHTFAYAVPADDQNYKYIVTYQTKVDTSKLSVDTTVKNNVTGKDGVSSSSTVGVVIPEEQKMGVTKAGSVSLDDDKKTTVWTITLNVPQGGLTDAIVTDTLPNMYLSNGVTPGTYYDELDYDKDSDINNDPDQKAVVIDNLQDNESYTIAVNEDHTVKISFFKDTEKTQTGLNASTQARIVTIKIKTKNNSTWMEATKNAEDYQKQHLNKVLFTDRITEVTAQASVNPVDKAYIEKKQEDYISNKPNGFIVENDTELPYYKYTITVGIDMNAMDPTGELEVEDYFDKNYLKCSTYKGVAGWGTVDLTPKVGFGSGTYGVGNTSLIDNPDVGSVEDSETGMKFKIKNNSIPANTKYVYLTYTLQVKDAEALSALIKDAAANKTDSSYIIKNSATYLDGSTELDSKYTYQAVAKELVADASVLNSSDPDNPSHAHFKLTVNPMAQTISDGNTVSVKDTYSDCVKVKLDSITFKNAANETVENCKYDISGNTLTFSIPDKKTVYIEYDVYVTQINDPTKPTTTVTISNEAVLNGVKSTTSNTASGIDAGAGSASIYSVNLLKHEKGDASKVLAGATFQLYQKDTLGNWIPVKDKLGNNATFTTNDKGVTTVKGSQNDDGWTLGLGQSYYLLEVTSPQGYQLSSDPIEFTISDKADRDNHIYIDQDTIYVSNQKLEESGNLVIKKTISGLTETLTTEQKQAITFNITGPNGYSNTVNYSSFDTNGEYKISDLALGDYKVEETAGSVAGYTVKTTYKVNGSEGSSATVEDGKTSTVEVTNEYTKETPKVGTLVVKKTFAGSELTVEQKKAIKFTITGTDSPKVITYADFTDGSYTISDLPLGEYTVVESNVDVAGYTVKTTYKVNGSEGSSATVEDGKTSTVEVTNEYTKETPKVGTLVVKKTFAGSELTDDQKKAIKFTITGTNYSKEVTYAEFSSGSYTISDLPLGEYTVVESNAEVTGYSVVTKYDVSGVEKNKVTIEDQTTSEVDVINTYTPIELQVNKTDVVHSQELDGSTIALFSLRDFDHQGNIIPGILPIAQWTSVKGVTFNFGPFLSVGENYVLSEIAAPEGYGLQQNIPFKVEETGKITITDDALSHYDDDGEIVFKDDITKVGFIKKDMSGKNYVEGAVLQVLDLDGKKIDEWTTSKETHVIEGILSVDETYVLHEVSAPEGYTIASDMKFTVSADRKTGDEWNVIQEVVMKDDVTNIEVHKVDDDKKFLAGASLQIEDLNGNVIQQWTTKDEAYSIHQVLHINETYKLVEKEAPVGYQVAEPIVFTLHDNGDVYIVQDKTETKLEGNILTMVDQKTTITPDTSDHSPTVLYIVIGVASVLALVFFVILRKKYKE